MPRRSLAPSLLLLLALCAPARADFFSSSPGPLVAAHASIDSKDHCQDCHNGLRELSRDKCLACHKPIAERQASHSGVHGNPKALNRPCELCHSDHRGRDKEILGWNTFGGKNGFDHTIADWPLDGKHKGLACARCHFQKTAQGTLTYLKAPLDCAGCHKNPHGETRDGMRQCERCHDAGSWKQIEKPRFDHGSDTKYPLLARHEGLTCAQCHATRSDGAPPGAKAAPGKSSGPAHLTFRWRSWASDCTPCHDNVHGASLFGKKKCALCHSAKTDFTTISFDHDRQTHFRLDGAHGDPARATCQSCHKKDERTKPEARCESCHKDVHAGRFDKLKKSDCALCHGSEKFRGEVRFDHAAHTRFRLDGAHAGGSCGKCHRGANPREFEHLEALVEVAGEKTSVACMGCHQHEKVHDKQYTNEQCLSCHKGAGVKDNRARAVDQFHGAGARFPLSDGHKAVKCIKCHPNSSFKSAPLVCGPACHPDTLHKGTLGPDCNSCHEGARWEARRFDHDTMTHWPLAGHHREVRCAQCHEGRSYVGYRGKETTCASCHARDDIHRGQLGTRCERCHSPDGKMRFDHNDPQLSSWRLDGKHAGVKCGACHESIQFKPTPRACEGCHGEPERHRGQLGVLCADCHATAGWKIIRTGHDVPSPRFGGAHDRVPCARCHVGGRRLAGTGALCITCHRNDDIHHNTLGPNCGECHTQRTFAGARFDHSRVGCSLGGMHRLQPCVACHVGGNFTAIAPNCVACHRGDARRATALSLTVAGMMRNIPNHDSYPTCASCHNTNFFSPAVRGDRRESVCR